LAHLPPPPLLPAALLLQRLNHLLAGQPWLRERLRPHAGRCCRVELSPLLLPLRVAADGSFALEQAEGEPDAVIRLSAVTAARLLAGDERARSGIALSGDAALAGAVAAVLQQLRWDFEEDLSQVIGDIAAHRVATGVRQLARWQRSALAALAGNAAEYLGEESGLLPRRQDVARWSQEVDTLRDAAERLEQRLARQLAPRPPRG
jgi:ubiquinone biosynthesis protein UbiJ